MTRPTRQRTLVQLVVLAVLSMLIGFLAARFVKSPAQVQANTAPPAVTRLTAVVEKHPLQDLLEMDGVVSPAMGETLPLLSPISEGRSLYSGVRIRAGQQVASGQVAVEISGRPVVLMSGAVPAYRTLAPGCRGVDVQQLQAALSGLGFTVHGDEDGHYGPGTSAAVARLYQGIGYDTVDVGTDTLRAARSEAAAAKVAVEDASRALTRLRRDKGPKPSLAILDGIRDAETARERARSTQTHAQAALDAAWELAGPSIPLGEAVFVHARPARVQSTTARVGHAVADSDVVVLGGSDLGIAANASLEQGPRLKVGQRAQLVGPDGKTSQATVARVVINANAQDPAIAVSVRLKAAGKLVGLKTGDAVAVRVLISQTPADSLVVPLATVSKQAGGRQVLVVASPSGDRTVAVKCSPPSNGFVAVQPVVPDRLAAGEKVWLGAPS